ncbi:MAG: hypothetical protein P1V97_25840 [Planctomycetota bacterium]|nr:hypothetical protein [Planctomycetota bacterium]
MNQGSRFQTLHEQRLCFETDGGSNHAPMIAVNCRSGQFYFILDTGASDHVLTRSFADSEDVTVMDSVVGKDHSGASVKSWTLESFSLTLEGFELELIDAVAIVAPPVFEDRRIGGILSVARLHSSAHVILDFERQELRLLVGDLHEIRDAIEKQRPNLESLVLDRVGDDTFLLVRAALLPYPEMTFLINTGGGDVEIVVDETEFGLDSLTVTGHGVGGEAVLGAIRRNQTLKVSGREFPVPKLILRQSMGAAFYSGDIGMAVLGKTMLLISAIREDPLFWFVPKDSAKTINH